MTGIDASAHRSSAPPPRSRMTLPASRTGLAWLGILVLVGAFVAFQVGRQVYASWSIDEQAGQVEAQIAAIEEENAALRRELAYLRSDAYITQAARSLANVGRRGEQLLIIPPGAAVEAPPAAEDEVGPPPPLLEQWMDLFFGS